MDVMSLNPVQSAASAGIAMDSALPQDAAAENDFSALLALGLNCAAQDAPQPRAQEETKADQALAADAPQDLIAATVADLLIALPQQASAADALPGTPNATQTEGTQPAKAASVALASSPQAAKSMQPADVAANAANIAASDAQKGQATHLHGQVENAEQRLEGAADPQSKHDIAIDVLRTNANDTATRAEPLSHAVHNHPTETRAPLSQPSALLEVQAPVSEPGFAQALSRQVVWMVDKDAQVAELRINPPELGPVEVRITLTQDSAAAEFVSPHAEVRSAIENAIVRLRESMAEAGIQLGEASVSAESFSGRADAQAQSRHSGDGYRDAPFEDRSAARSVASPLTLRRGLVDVFA